MAENILLYNPHPPGLTSFRLNDRVRVSADATGTGESPAGIIDHIEIFMRTPIISITYDRPVSDGRGGITLTNLGLITKIL